MYLSQALPLLALELDQTYVYSEIAALMPPPKQAKIEEVLARYARYNHFRGYDLPEGKTQAEFTRELEASHGAYARSIRVEYRLNKVGRFRRAFSGAVWYYHAGQKSLQEALVFALSACLLHAGRAYLPHQLLTTIPILAASPEWQHRLGQQTKRLLNAYDLLQDDGSTSLPGCNWARFVAPEVRRTVFRFIVGNHRQLVSLAAAERPAMIAAVAIRLQQAHAAKSRHLRRLLPKPQIRVMRLRSTKAPEFLSPPFKITSPARRITWRVLAIAAAALLLGAIGLTTITPELEPAAEMVQTQKLEGNAVQRTSPAKRILQSDCFLCDMFDHTKPDLGKPILLSLPTYEEPPCLG